MFFKPHYFYSVVLGCAGVISGTSVAAPNDVFLQPFAANPASPLSVEASFDIVNDTVDIFNLREGEGVTDDNAGDYDGGHLLLNYNFNPQWMGELGYWHRNIEYGQDSNQIDSWLAAVQYKPMLMLKPGDDVAIRLSLWGNQADDLSKTSPTLVNGQRFSSINVNDLSDIQAQVDLLFARRLDRQNKLNGFVSLGYSKVDVDSLNAQLSKGQCNFDIQVNSGNQYTGQLTNAPCTTADGTVFYKAGLTGKASDFGLDIDKDLSYDAGFLSLGGSWNWHYKKFDSQLGYQFQYLMRQDIDDRVDNYGSSAVKTNHTLGLDLSYQLNPYTRLFVAGQAFKNNFIGTIPFLYNSVTASRLDRKYGYASFGVRFANF